MTTPEFQILPKLVLKDAGDSAAISCGEHDVVKVTLRWQAAVDLDLYCFYQIKPEFRSTYQVPKKGLFGLLGQKENATTPEFGMVCFDQMGDSTAHPFIELDEDAGVGDAGGDNEENLIMAKHDHIQHALFVANIYAKPDGNFAAYDGLVLVSAGGQEIEVPLTDTKNGSTWCVVAHFDNSEGVKKLININKTQHTVPSIKDFA